MKIVIPSKNRADVLAEHSFKLFPDATVCVSEDEADAYRKITPNLLLHPATVNGIGPKRQWILDNVADDVVFMPDDDLVCVWSNVGFRRRRITDPATVQAIVERAAIIAADMRVGVFGFWQAAFTRYYANFDPFSLNTWVGTALGFVGRRFRYDEKLVLRADIDYCLQCLLHDRIMLMDCRFKFDNVAAFKGKGGNASNRSLERHQRELDYLKRKWGGHIEIVHDKQTLRILLKVPR